ncbi:hypothetical protein F5Y16DRAFT_401328 [Xylariaceae sp. FL0255]|nr:hypothetical protein F5Y16DRAFT_401328 [Xylariaceae sp. FL0255]
MLSTTELWYDARHPSQDPVDVSFHGKTILITGAHGFGLRHHAAVRYVALGADPLILAVRTQGKGEEAKYIIMQKAKCLPVIFVIEILDLSSFSSIKAFVDRINSQFLAIDVLQNARRHSTADIIVDRPNGRWAYILTTPDSEVYLWNTITQEVYEFTKPTV